jgi:hypothetical protein
MGEQTLKIARERGIVTLFSCSREQRSYEIEKLQQGAFTYALLEGLKQSTTPRALEEYLRQRVPALNLQHNKPPQVPLVIPEPGWKYDLPLLLSCATPKDIEQLKDQAKDAELEGDYALAESLWWQVIEAAQSTTSDRAEAEKAIRRIGKKQKPSITPAPPIERPLPEAEYQEKLRQEEGKQKVVSLPKKPPTSKEVELKSERGVDYTKLRDLLAEGKWKEADQKTGKVMCQAARRESEGWLNVESIDNFPCEDLRTINQLWLHYSNGKFGFSVQKEIYESLGGTREYNAEVWKNFGDRLLIAFARRLESCFFSPPLDREGAEALLLKNPKFLVSVISFNILYSFLNAARY